MLTLKLRCAFFLTRRTRRYAEDAELEHDMNIEKKKKEHKAMAQL